MRNRIRALLALRPSRIGLRLLAFNLLLVFLPVAGILYLDVYETQLLEQQERGMVQQGRLVAAALGDRGPLTTADASALVQRLDRRVEARIRVYDATGALLADSVRSSAPTEASPGEYSSSTKGARQTLLYRVGAWMVRLRRVARSIARDVLVPAHTSDPSGPAGASSRGPALEAALDGRYGADARPTPGQRSLTLYSAVPIRDGGSIVGAAVVSQSTFRILQALYSIRLRIFQIVVASIAAAVGLGFLMSATLVRPIVRLRRAALALSDRRATPAGFGRVKRRDEIGDLARTLEDLTGRLDAHIKLLESFAADVSHEFRNPLASIRVAAEMIAASDDGSERARFLEMLTRDVDRLERLVSGVRELARIDAQIAHDAVETVDLVALLRGLVAGFGQRAERVRFTCTGPDVVAPVRAAPDRLAQVFENVLENAASFSPPDSVAEVTFLVEAGACVVRVADRGPGIPAAHLERMFERFFSYRPTEGTRREHMGLGLAIARAIVEGYAGLIRAENRDGGGAIVEIRLPLTVSQPSSRAAQVISPASSVSYR